MLFITPYMNVSYVVSHIFIAFLPSSKLKNRNSHCIEVLKAHTCPPKTSEHPDCHYPSRKAVLYVLLCTSAKINHCKPQLSKMGYLRLLEEEEDRGSKRGRCVLL